MTDKMGKSLEIRTNAAEEQKGLIRSILSDSTVQGFTFIGSKKLHILERVFWGAAVIACLIYSGILIRDLYQKYKTNHVIISFQPDESSIRQIPFPAITLCNVNIFKSSVIDKTYWDFIARFGNSTDRSNDSTLFQLSYIMEHLAQFCLVTPSFRRKTKDHLCNGLGYPDVINHVQSHYLQNNESHLKFDNFEYAFNQYQMAMRKSHANYMKSVQSCHDMILRCVWSGKEIPCKQTFFPIDRRQGRCCTFNMMPIQFMHNISKNDRIALMEGRLLPKRAIKDWKRFTADDIVRKKGYISPQSYPKRQALGGRTYGLSIVVNPEIKHYSTCTTNDAYGFTMEAHSPLSQPNNRDYGSAIPVNSEVFVEIDPLVTDANSGVMKDIRIEDRDCYIDTDKEAKLISYNFYTVENCMAECFANAQFAKCQCIQSHLPRLQVTTPCAAKLQDCAEEVVRKLIFGRSRDRCAHCKPPCTSIDYSMAVHGFKLRKEVLDIPFQYTGFNGTEKNASNYSIIHIYFGSDSFYIKERTIIYNTADFVADAGGLLGFTLGISLVSLLEFLYYFTLRIFFHYRHKSIQKSKKNVEQLTISSIEHSPQSRLRVQGKIDVNQVTHKQSSNVMIYPFLR